MCVCVCVCVFQNRVRVITSPYMMRFENNLAQMIIMSRTRTLSLGQKSRSQSALCIDFSERCSCPGLSFVMHRGI